jgi:hypothetical protein
MSEFYEHSKWVVERAKEHGRSDTCKFGDALIGVLSEMRGQVRSLEEKVADLDRRLSEFDKYVLESRLHPLESRVAMLERGHERCS